MFGLTTKKIIFILAGVFFVLIVILALVARAFLGQTKPVNLIYYSLWEDPAVMEGVIADYQRLHPNVKIEFLRQNQIQYKDRVLSALQTPSSPDIVRIHSTWIPLFKPLLAPITQDVMTVPQFNSTYYKAAGDDLISGGKIYAIPLEIDGLVMFVNTDLLQKAGLSPATTWEEFQEQVQKLTVRDSNGRIQTAGAALGVTKNVDHWQDIVSLMFLQNGADIRNPSGQTAEGALNFYVDYAKKLNVWDETLDGSTVAFAGGKVAYYFGPTWRYFDIKQIAGESKLNFKMVPVPQISGEPNPVTQSSYWVEAVSAKSPNKAQAMDFLKFLSTKENAIKMYSAQTKLREFGEPYARIDLKDTLASDPNLSAFIGGAQNAKSSFLTSATWDGDSGINGFTSQYYENAINAILQSSDAAQALETLSSGMQQINSKLGGN